MPTALRHVRNAYGARVIPPQPINPAEYPFLSGCFAPITTETDRAGLPVEGEIPADLHGTYLRNGGNPRFPPLGGFVYPFEGDAMVHAVHLEDGTARYRNRFIRTPQLELEEKAGHAIWASLMSGYQPDPQDVGELAYRPKDLPSINVVRHAGKLIALAEQSRSFQITEQLETLGPETLGDAFPMGFCAHPKVDPQTGEMLVFQYALWAPYLQWAVVGPDGTVTSGPTPVAGVDAAHMVHDFVITATKIVLVISPAVFELEKLLRGEGSPLDWRPEQGTRIAVIDRADGSTAWYQTDPFWSWHYGNGFDDGDDVVFDGVRWDSLGIGLAGDEGDNHGAYVRFRLRPGTTDVGMETVVDREMEFPRIDDRLIGQRHRQVAVGTRIRDVPVGQFDALMTLNPDTGATAVWDARTLAVGEPCYAGGLPAHVRDRPDRLLELPADPARRRPSGGPSGADRGRIASAARAAWGVAACLTGVPWRCGRVGNGPAAPGPDEVLREPSRRRGSHSRGRRR